MHRHRQRDLGARDRLIEGQRNLCLQIAAALPTRAPAPAAAGAAPPPRSAAEQVGEDVPHPRGVEVEALKAAEASTGPAAGGERSRAAVVLLALLGVAEHVVGLGDLLEALLRRLVVGIAIGVVGAGEFAVGLLDLLRARLLVDPQGLVVVGP